MTLFHRFVVATLVLAAVQIQAFASNKVINDSLMRNLPCATLDKSTFLLSAAPDAYSVDRQIPIRNWASGGGLAECWSLSHTQRMIYLMGRLSSDQALQDVSSFTTASDVVRGKKDDRPQVFPIGSSVSALINSLDAGFTDSSGDHRRFKSDIEHYQDWRFYQPGNFSMITGSRDRPLSRNVSTFNGIQDDLTQGRLPIVVIRAALTTQHAVLIKKVFVQDGGMHIYTVYDSNYPDRENYLFYDPIEREFYAPDIMGRMTRDSGSPVGVFLVDDDDMDNIQDALFKYYQKQCSDQSSSDQQ